MKKFRFTLQPALDAAAHREHAAGFQAERAHAAVDEAFAALAALDAEGANLTYLRRSLPRAATTATPWIVADIAAGALRRATAERRRALGATRTLALAADGALLVARRARMALDRLRERRRSEYLAHLERLEAAELDESNAARFGSSPV